MAILNLTIHGVKLSQNSESTKGEDLLLSTEEIKDDQEQWNVVKKEIDLTDSKGDKTKYGLTLINLQFHKKMYQPTEIKAEISVVKGTGTTYKPITRDFLIQLFEKKKVSLVDVQGLSKKESVPAERKVGTDFYVHDVKVKYKQKYMRIVLTIYSLDKLLTLENTCRAFVAKKLKDGILESELSKIVRPYGGDDGIKYDADSMQNIGYELGDKKTEHIFPFLVQYNESFYDMLARTTNRWGEFLYYEDGKLIVGCPKTAAIDLPMTADEAKKSKIPLFKSLDYIDIDDMEAAGSNYETAASYESKMLKDPYRIDPEKISGTFFWPFDWWGGKWDKVLMKKFSKFFKNDKNIPTFVGNEVFADSYDLAKKALSVKQKNDKRKEEFFTDKKKAEHLPEQYGDYNFGTDDNPDKSMGFNPFSEIKPACTNKKYFTILTNEIAASKNAVCINFDTSYPCLKLGEVIRVYGKEYIVTQIDCQTDVPLKMTDDLWVVSSGKAKYAFVVTAIAKQHLEEKDKDGKAYDKFFPTVIPAGHVRLAEPQIGTVTDASDPNYSGRVRVLFSWQSGDDNKFKNDIEKKTKDKKDLEKKEKEATTDSKKGYQEKIKALDAEITKLKKDYETWKSQVASPWLQFAANAGGKKGIMGAHYEGDKVFIGFVDGNVERPYVLGAISKGAGADIHCATPGGHELTIGDDKSGIRGFLTGMFSPSYNTFGDFIPGVAKFNPFSGDKNNLALAGGFELTDKYGIYKISGSTNYRSIDIQSPWGNVNVNAFTGITISAPNGDISIKGKNVSIEAGNNLTLTSGKNVNYKLWKDKGKDTASQFMLDVAAAVTKKLAESLINIVDLSMIRNVIEIVMRPVEGKLTVKSNRYLMLEAGKSECKYPEAAYARPEDIQKKLDTKAMDDIVAGAGVGTIRGVGTGMVELFGSIPGIINHIDETCCDRYKRLPIRKARLKEQLETLNDWKNSIGGDVEIMTGYAKPENFESWFENQIVPKLWGQAEFKEFKEDDLGFTDEVAVEGSANDIVKSKCHNAHYNRMAFTSMHFFGARNARVVDEAIIAKRKELRRACLKTLNKLAKGCWQLEHFYMDELAIGKYLSAFAFTPVPAKFKEKMTEAFSYKKCKNSRYYNFSTIPNKVKLLKSSSISIHKEYSEYDRKYLKRLVTMNLLEEFGFTDDLRKEIDITVGTGAAAQTVKKKPEKPKTDKLDIDINNPVIPADHILDNNCWENYVNSLSAIPPLGKADTTIGAAIKGAAGAALDNLMFWKGLGERSTWSAGSNGKIMFAIGKDTYSMNKSAAADGPALVSKENTMSSKITSLSDKDFEYFDAEKQAIQEFVGKIKTELLNY